MRTLEPGSLLPFLCLDETNQPDGVTICASPAKKDTEPVLAKNPQKWTPDEFFVRYPTVVFDPQINRFRMWYFGFGKAQNVDASPHADEKEYNRDRGFVGNSLYAESEDGLYWERPQLGLVEFNGSKRNNILGVIHKSFHSKAVVMDETEEDPRKRFKCLFTASGNQILSYSEDGINWEKTGVTAIQGPMLSGYHESCCFLVDPTAADPERRFLAYSQAWGDDNRHPLPTGPAYQSLSGSQYYTTQGQQRRRIGVAYGPDETHMKVWPQLAMDPDEGLEEQIHMMSVMPYEGYYLGLYEYTWFDLESRTDLCDLRLAVSRDGLRWTRIQNQVPVVARGERGTWDDGMIVSPNQPIKVGDEVWIYYSGARWQQGWMGTPYPDKYNSRMEAGIGGQIGRAVLPYDRVTCVRVRQWLLEGSFRTDPLIIGKEVPEFLQVNMPTEPDALPYVLGPPEEAFAITVNEEDGSLIATLDPVPQVAGRFKLPREILEQRGPDPFRLHISIQDPFYGICSLKAL